MNLPVRHDWEWEDRLARSTLPQDAGLLALTVGFVDDLCHANHLALVVADWHRQDDVRFVARLLVDFTVEPGILVRFLDVDGFVRLGHRTGDTDPERNDDFVLLGLPYRLIEC